ncbi:MAG TPA: energy transducer TonB [Methylocystis sp.]|nr:energy transducer TonB [Methylocystis sp.]
MSLAAAPTYEAPFNEPALREDASAGAQNLLHLEPPPPNYPARVGAIALYLLALGAIVTVGFKTNETPIEEQQVIELAPLPVEEPQVEDTPPPPEAIDIPDIPPPEAISPMVPIEQPQPVEKPKVEKPKPQPVQKVAPRAPTHPVAAAKPAPHVAAPPMRAPAPPPGATASAIANQFHACMQRAASNYDAPRSGRVSYSASFSASGSLTSYSISPSGVAALDSIASRLGGRCGSVAAPGRPVSLSGAISFTGP